MDKEYGSNNKIEVVEDITSQIIKILESEDMTYGMAKMIIQRVEAELLKSGDIFLKQTKFKKVSPIMFIGMGLQEKPEETCK